MRILLAAASLSSELSGVQRHAFNVVRCLLSHPKISMVKLVIAPWQQELFWSSGLLPNERVSLHLADMKTDAWHRNRWYYRELPEMARQLRADVAHLTYPAPLNARAFDCPTVVTLHDLYPYEIPANFGFPKVIFNRLILQQCLGGVDAIACVSDITRLLLNKHVSPRVQQKAVRIYNSVEPQAECATHSPIHDWRGEPFFLCVAQHRQNKNLPFLLRALRHFLQFEEVNPSTKLVIVGIPGPETDNIRRTIARLGLYRNVQLMEGLPEPELQWCYRNCEAVLAPSKTEGFGLPVTEALLAGCRVICSDIPAFRELGGDFCHYVPLNGQAERVFAEEIRAALQKPLKGPLALPMLSTSVIAEQYTRLYRKLLGSAQTMPELVPSV
jgi:glycosyltransferase involved in cell wall biosynthesis